MKTQKNYSSWNLSRGALTDEPGTDLVREISPARREYLKNYQRNWIRERRLIWLEANGPCQRCGSWKRLEVDHIDPSLKTNHRIWSWGAERRDAELKKCQVLCRTCHRAKTTRESGTRRTGKPAHAHKLTEERVLEIYRRAKAGEGPRALGVAFSVHHSTVIKIRDRRVWVWLTSGSPQLELIPSQKETA